MSETLSAIDGLVDRANSFISDEQPDPRAALRSAVKSLTVEPGDPAWTDGFDVYGEAYQRLLSNEQRRPLGQFFTPLWVGKLLAEWALGNDPKILLDPACGSGSLLIAATKLQPSRDVRLVGQDVDPLLLDLGAENMRVRQIGRLEFHRADFLLEEPEVRPDAIVCNPPYTRHQDLDSETKELIHDGFASRIGLELSRQSSLHALFLARAIEVANEGARLAFITPSHWLDMNYGRAVKRYLLEHATVNSFVVFPVKQQVFGEVETTATITLITKTPPSKSSRTKVFAIPPEMERDLDLKAVRTRENLQVELQLSATSSWRHKTLRSSGRSLSEFLSVHRGIATGYNGFFVLSDEERTSRELPSSVLLPCAPPPRMFSGTTIDEASLKSLAVDVPKWLLHLRDGSKLDTKTTKYIDFGRDELDVPSRYLVDSRTRKDRPWYSVEDQEPSPILFSYFNRENPRFVRNLAGAVALNHWMLIRPLANVDADSLFAILQDWSIMERLHEASRVYSNGLWKLEPSEMLKVRIPIKLAGEL